MIIMVFHLYMFMPVVAKFGAIISRERMFWQKDGK